MPSKPPALEGLRALVRDLDAGSRSLPHYPQVPMLQQVQREWSELRSELQVRRSLRAEAPADGGPLNSAVLVQRMLDTMQATSPGYLRHFIDYVDTLSGCRHCRMAPPAAVIPQSRNGHASRADH